MTDVIEDRLETILLARLGIGAKPPGLAALAKVTHRFAPTTLTLPAWRDVVEAALVRMASRGLIDAARVAKPDALASRIGSSSAKKWEQWQRSLLPALALGLRPEDAVARRKLSLVDGWAAAIAARALGVWTSGPPLSAKQLGDALIWRDLGLSGAPERCPPALHAHFLRTHVAKADGSPSKVLKQLAAQAVRAANADSAALRDALVRQWLTGAAFVTTAPTDATQVDEHVASPPVASPPVASPPVASPPVTSPPAASPPMAPVTSPPAPSPQVTRPPIAAPAVAPLNGASLIPAAREAAQRAVDGVFGDRKVFISAVWDALRAQPAFAQLALDDFKRALVVALREGHLQLARADYVSAMDPRLVAASETRADGATFHFIVREVAR